MLLLDVGGAAEAISGVAGSSPRGFSRAERFGPVDGIGRTRLEGVRPLVTTDSSEPSVFRGFPGISPPSFQPPLEGSSRRGADFECSAPPHSIVSI